MPVLRPAFRTVWKAPAVSAIAISSMALGVGATAVVFAAVKAVLIEPFPYRDPDRLVQFRTIASQGGASRQDWVNWLDMQDAARENRSFESVATYHYSVFNLAGDSTALPEALYGVRVSANLFPVLGVKPMIGRSIRPEETQPGREHEIILSYDLWKRRFEGDPSVIGRNVVVNGHDCEIIGVMPRGFDFPMRLATTVATPSRHMDYWAPDAVDPATIGRNGTGHAAIGRLKPGVTIEQARQDIDGIAARLSQAYPQTNEGRILQIASLRERTLGFATTGLALLMAAALVFLLISCANVANLLLARGLGRQREIAIRVAVGASRSAILRQFVTESAVQAACGGLLGYLLAILAWRWLPSLTPMSIPRLAAARADWTVFAFSMAVSLLNGVVCGLAPAWRVTRNDPGDPLRAWSGRASTGPARNRLRSLLLVSEIGVTVVLVVIGGTLTGSFMRLLRTNPGFDTDRVLASIVVPAGSRYTRPGNRTALYRDILASVRALPGVEAAGATDGLPFSGENTGGFLASTDTEVARPSGETIGEVDRVSSGYLEAMGVRLVRGRWFREEEMDPSRDVAIVNEIAAARFWPHANPIGQRICINCTPEQPLNWKRVIGVAGNVRHASLDEQPGPQVYLAGNALASAVFLVVRTSQPSAPLAGAIRRAVAQADPNQPVFLSASMSRLIGDSLSDRRFILALLGITGVLALLLSAAGIYGVVSYLTSRRTREFGVRMALGAAPWQVHVLVFRQSMAVAALGVAIGMPAALASMRLVRQVVPGAGSTDPGLVALAVALVLAVSAAACWIPSFRTTRVDPLAALRTEQ